MIKGIRKDEIAPVLGLARLAEEFIPTDAPRCEPLATEEKDTAVIYRIARSISPRHILEIGTLHGHTTVGLAANCPQATVYTMDICREMGIPVPRSQAGELLGRDEVGGCFRGRDLNIVQLFADSRLGESYRDLPEMDMVFVDGNHSFKAILADSRNALAVSRSGAVIIWHDYKWRFTVGTALALRFFSRAIRRTIYHVKGTWLAMMLAP